MRRILEFKANQIEMVLASHGITSRVVGGMALPRTLCFQLATRMGTRISRIKALSEEIALSLNSPTRRIVRNNGRLNVKVPRAEPAEVPLLSLRHRLGHVAACSPLIGVDEAGTPLLLNLCSPDVARVLVCGTTDLGKTALARAMALSLALHNPQRRLQLVLIDPKGRRLRCLSTLPHLLCPPLTGVAQAPQHPARLVRKMERRDAQGTTTPRVLVFVDELADLLMTGGKEPEFVLTHLSQRGREAAVHLIACTQKRMAAVLPESDSDRETGSAQLSDHWTERRLSDV